MINKKIETGTKALRDFIEFWGKFHSIYNITTSKDIITSDDENKFLETKAAIKTKYEELNKRLDVRYMPHGRLTDPVDDLLALKTIRFISEDNLKKVENDWKDSYVFLNNIMEQLINKKRMAEDFNPVSMFFKRIFD